MKHAHVAAIVAAIVLGSAAVASGADGDPLILGELSNASESETYWFYDDPSPGAGAAGLTIESASNALALSVTNSTGEFPAARVFGYTDALIVNGSTLTDRAGVVVVPAGATRITFRPVTGVEADSEDPVRPDTIMIATVQGNVAASVKNVSLNATADTATIRLTQAGSAKISVGWFTLRPFNAAIGPVSLEP